MIKYSELIHGPVLKIDKILKVYTKEELKKVFEAVKAISDFESEKLSEMGYEITGVIGKGNNGVAYNLSNGQVLKVTDDAREIAAASNIVGKKFKNVYRVFRVFKFKKNHDNIAYIVAEKLHKVSVSRDVIYAVEKENPTKLHSKEDMAIYDQLTHGLEELRSVGIDYFDTHAGNVMQRSSDKNYVWIDLGSSTGPSSKIEIIHENIEII